MFREGLGDKARLCGAGLLVRPPPVSLSMIISPDTPEGGEEALLKYYIFHFSSTFHVACRVNSLITSLKEDGLEPRTLLANLEYVREALNHLLFLKKE